MNQNLSHINVRNIQHHNMAITLKQVEYAIIERHDGDVYRVISLGINIYNKNIDMIKSAIANHDHAAFTLHLGWAIENVKILQQMIDLGNSHKLKCGKIID